MSKFKVADLSQDRECAGFHDLMQLMTQELSPRDFLYTPEHLVYVLAYLGDRAKNLSFAIADASGPVAWVPLICTDNRLCFFEHPIRLFCSQQLDSNTRYQIHQLAKQKLEQLSATHKMDNGSFFAERIFSAMFHKNIVSEHIEKFGVVDLSLSEELIYSTIRRSYKQGINWGRKNLVVKVVKGADAPRADFDAFKAFHIHVAQRQTRNDLTWDLQYEALVKGRAFMVLAYLGEKLVAGVYSFMGPKTAFYGVAVNDRSLMAEKQMLGHWPLLKSIYVAKELGLAEYNLGLVSSEGAEEKAQNIATFKMGFTSNLDVYTVFDARISNPEPAAPESAS